MLPLLIVTKSKRTADKAIAQILKDHSINQGNIITLEKDGTSLKIETIRSLMPFLARSSSSLRAVILYDFETTGDAAQNAMLKTLEEATDTTLFILVCSDLAKIVSTIFSRVKIVRFIDKTPPSTILSFEALYKTIFSKTDKITKEKALQYIDEFIAIARNTMKIATSDKNNTSALQNAQFIKECVSCRSLLVSNNLNAQIVVDHLIINASNLIS